MLVTSATANRALYLKCAHPLIRLHRRQRAAQHLRVTCQLLGQVVEPRGLISQLFRCQGVDDKDAGSSIPASLLRNQLLIEGLKPPEGSQPVPPSAR